MTVVTEVVGVFEEDVSEAEVVPPVLNETLWRFAIAMATSRSLAETDEAVKSARRRVMASERMMRGGLPRFAKLQFEMVEFVLCCLQKGEGRSLTNGLVR